MPSQSAQPFDKPQMFRSAPPSYHQTQSGYERQQIGSIPPKVSSIDAKRSGRRRNSLDYLYQQRLARPDFTGQMLSLQQHYTILESNDVIIKFLDEQPSIYILLKEAVKPLQSVFGPERIIRMRTQVSDDESLIKIAVQFTEDFRRS